MSKSGDRDTVEYLRLVYKHLWFCDHDKVCPYKYNLVHSVNNSLLLILTHAPLNTHLNFKL